MDHLARTKGGSPCPSQEWITYAGLQQPDMQSRTPPQGVRSLEARERPKLRDEWLEAPLPGSGSAQPASAAPTVGHHDGSQDVETVSGRCRIEYDSV